MGERKEEEERGDWGMEGGEWRGGRRRRKEERVEGWKSLLNSRVNAAARPHVGEHRRIWITFSQIKRATGHKGKPTEEPELG